MFFDIDKEKAAHPDDFRNDLSTVRERAGGHGATGPWIAVHSMQVMRLLGEGRLHPIVHSRLALADAATALREVRDVVHVVLQLRVSW